MGLTYEIVWTETKDKLGLYGVLKEGRKSRTILINIHGTASNFYEEDFITTFARELPELGISVLSTNNRGAGVYDAYQKSGAAVELFEDCLIDIDTWIEFAFKRGYNKIILSGHSLGTEKVVYYMNNGKYRKRISAIILLAPADSFAEQHNFLKKAEKLIKLGKSRSFLDRDSYSGIMPKSAKSLVNFLGKGSKVQQALPFHSGKLLDYRKIKIPILAVIGDKHEYTVLPIPEALKLMRKENKNTETHQLKNCNHDFEGKEEELTEIIKNFLKKRL